MGNLLPSCKIFTKRPAKSWQKTYNNWSGSFCRANSAARKTCSGRKSGKFVNIALILQFSPQCSVLCLWNCCSRVININKLLRMLATMEKIVFCFFLIGIHSMQGWKHTMRHGVTRKRRTKKLKHTKNLFRKSLQLKDVC